MLLNTHKAAQLLFINKYSTKHKVLQIKNYCQVKTNINNQYFILYNFKYHINFNIYYLNRKAYELCKQLLDF